MSCIPSPSSRSVTTFWRKTTGVSSPAKRFISASTSIRISSSASLRIADLAPRITVSITPPGANCLSVSITPTSLTALAYLWAYGMPG